MQERRANRNEQSTDKCKDESDCECWGETDYGGPGQECWDEETGRFDKEGIVEDYGMMHYCSLKILMGPDHHRPIDRLYIKVFDAQMRAERDNMSKE